jgi:hypothetical protein
MQQYSQPRLLACCSSEEKENLNKIGFFKGVLRHPSFFIQTNIFSTFQPLHGF